MHALRDIELLNYILSPSYIKGNKLSKVGHNVSSGLWIEIGVLQGSVKYETAMRKNCHSHFFFYSPEPPQKLFLGRGNPVMSGAIYTVVT